MKTYLSWSGGKDSSASIILCHEQGIPLDGVIFSEVMFDLSRNISGENPEHIKWVYETAIPTPTAKICQQLSRKKEARREHRNQRRYFDL